MDGVVSGGGAALWGTAKLPPQRDEDGGNDDEQTQGYPSDRHNVVGLPWTLGLKRRWTRWLESYKKKKGGGEQMYSLELLSLHGFIKISEWLL